VYIKQWACRYRHVAGDERPDIPRTTVARKNGRSWPGKIKHMWTLAPGSSNVCGKRKPFQGHIVPERVYVQGVTGMMRVLMSEGCKVNTTEKSNIPLLIIKTPEHLLDNARETSGLEDICKNAIHTSSATASSTAAYFLAIAKHNS
jgi:hypothetical protein